MSASRLLLCFLSVLLIYSISVSSISPLEISVAGLASCLPNHIETLTQFKNEFDSNACNHTDYFNGASCDNTTGEVTMLQLPGGCLSGTLKPNSSLFGMHHLRYLNLSYNNFTSSSLPSGFGNLHRLEVLVLSFNGFIGQVPSSISNLSMLIYLDLSHNELTGSFPLVGNLTKLSVLSLSYNHFSSTNLNANSSLFGLHHLRYLDLNHNNFSSSSLVSEFGSLKRLEVLSLSSNGLIGQVPSSFSNLSRLTELYLDLNKLTGRFPLVHNLSKLSLLNLAHNHFFGAIPSSLFTMPFLTTVDLSDNHLTGSIEVPNTSTPSRLEFLYLGHNNFEGKILEHISKFITLKCLDLSFLNTSYPIGLSLFSSLKSLFYLDLSGNSISPASLSSDLGIPKNLVTLALSNCNIKEFPNILMSLQSLESIDISNNKIEGKIPEWLWKLPLLYTVKISNNSFTGFEGSTEIIANSSVGTLDLSINSFEGVLPNLPLSINVLFAEFNSFTGNIPLSICNRTSLAAVVLSYNNFTGPIPQCLSNFMIVDLRKNRLEGSIPNKFYADTSLKTIDLGYNRLTGKLPRSFVNCSSLTFLSVDNNVIEDTFPFWLKELPNLQVLVLSSNKLYGPIAPPRQGPLGFPELQILHISKNKFNGSLPPSYFVNWKASSSLTMNEEGSIYMEYNKDLSDTLEYGYMNSMDLDYKGLSMEQSSVLTSYSAIDFSGNRIEGQIPESIGLLKALIALNLSNNRFTGHIPMSLGNLTELESLDLSRNQLLGTIPKGIGSLSFLAYINVSYNQLMGEIPQGTQITGQSKSSFEGNGGLCGLPLEESCFGTNAPPTHQPEREDEKEEEVLNWKAAAIGYGSGVLFGLAISQVIASYKPEWLAKIIGQNNRINH